MAEITSAGYQSIRDLIEANWLYIELRDSNGDAVVRLPLSDSRVSWTHEAGAQTLILTAVVIGSDSDIPVPTVFGSSAIYKVASNGDALSVEELPVQFSILTDLDQLTVHHSIAIPEVG